jgi:cell division protein FtsW
MAKHLRSKVVLKNPSNRPDWLIIGLVLGLTVFGIVMVGNASVVKAYQDFADKFYYLRLQVYWALLGIGAFLVTSLLDYRFWKKVTIPLLIFSLISLILVLIPGIGREALGAKRWLGLGFFSFQPAELAKLAFIFYLSSFFTKKKNVWPFLATLAVLVGLIMFEPDLGTTVVLVASGLSIYFVSGASIFSIGLIALLGIISGVGLIFFSPYRKERLLTFFDPSKDPLGASYHIRQILVAIGSGGLFGVGLGQSRQKYEYLPEVTTDSIFAVIAEEIGFIGGVIIIALFLLLIWRGFRIAKEAPDEFGKLLAVGITAWIGFQALINLCSMVALVPLTGIPLPFISYGGSSLILSLAAMGILVNISKQRVLKK